MARKAFPVSLIPLRKPAAYADYLRSATEKSLARCGGPVRFALRHNLILPVTRARAFWQGMARLKDGGLTNQIGIASGPANGFHP